jgi:hypothetical protein
MLHGRPWRVIAKALPNDDVIAECKDEVAVACISLRPRSKSGPPWPLTTFMASADEFEPHVASESGWEPRRTLIGKRGHPHILDLHRLQRRSALLCA